MAEVMSQRIELSIIEGEIAESDIEDLFGISRVGNIIPIPTIPEFRPGGAIGQTIINITEIKGIAPATMPRPTMPGNYLSPYLKTPDQTKSITPSIPRAIHAGSSALQTPKDKVDETQIAYPDEQKTVETILTPFGIIRKTADTMGRLRTTGSGIQYNAGKLDTTDTDAHTLYTGYGSKKISIFAKTGGYTLKILTLYDWLSGKTIDDMDTITIDEGQSFNMEIEAREVEATAAADTASEIYWSIIT